MGEAIQEKADGSNPCKLTNGYPKDRLHEIAQTNHKKFPISYSEQPDLTLRLSLGGVFSQNPKASPLIRSSSVAGVITPTTAMRESGGVFHRGLSLSLDRTSSLPSATAQKGPIKLKEFQSFRTISSHEIGLERLLSSTEKKSSDTQSSTRQRKIIDEARVSTLVQDHPRKKAKKKGEISSDIAGTKVMTMMPSVMAAGDGPEGKKVEGFLYIYNGGEVSIVCVCHGSFLSPAEFVKHAGGVDVVNPMKHIRVCSNASSF